MNKAHKTCPKCSAMFKNSTHFHRHVKRCGTTEHNVPCPICSKTFTRKDNLKTHIKKQHLQSTPTAAPGFTFNHTTHCGTTATRYQCLQCPLSFSRKDNLQRHIQQQHSKTSPQFTCPTCGKGFTTKNNRNLHLATVCAEVKPCYSCWCCPASFTRLTNRQKHMRLFHGRICQDRDMNLLLHLQHLSEEPDCNNKWKFVESRPIERDEHHICPCGQPHIASYFFLENKLNGNRTFVGSTCIGNIDPRVAKIIAYFQHILSNPIQGRFVGHDSNGLQTFTVQSNTKLVSGAEDVIQHLNPQVFCNVDGNHHVLVKYPKTETLVQGQSYTLLLKANYVRGQLTFTAV